MSRGLPRHTEKIRSLATATCGESPKTAIRSAWVSAGQRFLSLRGRACARIVARVAALGAVTPSSALATSRRRRSRAAIESRAKSANDGSSMRGRSSTTRTVVLCSHSDSTHACSAVWTAGRTIRGSSNIVSSTSGKAARMLGSTCPRISAQAFASWWASGCCSRSCAASRSATP